MMISKRRKLRELGIAFTIVIVAHVILFGASHLAFAEQEGSKTQCVSFS